MTEYDKLMVKRKRRQLVYLFSYLFPIIFFLLFIDVGLGLMMLGILGETFNVSLWLLNRQLRRLEGA